jgi:hypothetical protein
MELITILNPAEGTLTPDENAGRQSASELDISWARVHTHIKNRWGGRKSPAQKP